MKVLLYLENKLEGCNTSTKRVFGPFRVCLVLNGGGGECERKYENVSVDVDIDVVSSLHLVRVHVLSEPLKTQR